jgi:hypothetical protein
MPKSISLSWSDGVREEESGLLGQTIEKDLKSLCIRYPDALVTPPIPVRSYGNWIIPALVPDSPYWGIQWYIASSYDADAKQVIAPTYLELVRKEPWQQLLPHYDLVLLDQDLTDFPAPLARLRPDYYSLGTSFPGVAAVLSVHRVRRLSDERVRELAMIRLVRHHLGHVLGAPAFEREESIARRGMEMHCTNVCVMRHAATVEELAEYAVEEADSDWPFCPTCTRELYSVIIGHARDWN